MRPHDFNHEKEMLQCQAATARRLRDLGSHLYGTLVGRGGAKFRPTTREEYLEISKHIIEASEAATKLLVGTAPPKPKGRPPKEATQDPSAAPPGPGAKSFAVGKPARPA